MTIDPAKLHDILFGFLLGSGLVTIPVTVAIIIAVRFIRRRFAEANRERLEAVSRIEATRRSINAGARRSWLPRDHF